MNTMKETSVALVALTTCLVGASFNSMAMAPHIENALIEVCKAAKSDNLFRYKEATKPYSLKDKTVALKVMCNGTDIIDFAEQHGADKTAAKLQRSIGNVSITDVAAVSKINVTFTE